MKYDKENRILMAFICFIYGLIALFVVFTIGVIRVKADTSPSVWYDGFRTPLYGQYYRWTSASANSNQATEEINLIQQLPGVNGTSGTYSDLVGKGFSNTTKFTITNYGLTIRITTNETMKSNYLYSWQVGLCSDVSLNNVNYNKISYTLTGTEQYTYGTKINVSSSPTSFNTYSSCKIYSGLVSGESGSNNLYLKLVASTNTSSGYFYTIGYQVQELGMWDENLRSIMQSVISSSGLATASSVAQVQQATNEVKQEVQSVNDTMNNSNVDSGTGSDFFNNFSTSDNGGLSSIITAPLSAIQSMLSGTCTDLTGTYQGKNFSLPCGTSFWSNLGAIKTLINLTLGGIICYGIIRKLYLKIHELKNPDEDRVEVMSL